MGGNLNNPSTYRLARAWQEAGVASLRFNFRGVGGSTGRYDEGRGELDDARTALGWLRSELPQAALFASGFSFGSRTALELSLQEPTVRAVLAVGFPVDVFDPALLAQLRTPVAFVQLEHDEYGALPRFERALATVTAPRALFVVEGSDHLSSGRQDALARALTDAVRWCRAAAHSS
jgi:hypothetical protein